MEVDILRKKWDNVQQLLKERISNYTLCDPDIEEEVKIKVILRLLRELDYDPEAYYMHYERKNINNNNRLDIQVSTNFIIEAKKLSKTLTIKDQNQLFEYLSEHQQPIGVLTNGRIWKWFRKVGTDYEEFKIIDFCYRLTNDDLIFLESVRLKYFYKSVILNWESE